MTGTQFKINVYSSASSGLYYWAAWVRDNGEWEYDTNGECPDDIASDSQAVSWAENEWPGAIVSVVEQTV